MRNVVPITSIFFIVTALLGCQGDEARRPGGQTGEIAALNCEGTYAPYEVNEVTPLGFTAEEVFGTLGLPHTTEMLWWDGAVAELLVTVEHDNTQDSGLANYQNPTDAGCTERVEIPIRMTLQTEDGRLDFSMQGDLSATSAVEGTLQFLAGAEYNNGDLDFAALAGNAYDPNTASLLTTTDFGGGLSVGELVLFTHNEIDGDAVQLSIGTW